MKKAPFTFHGDCSPTDRPSDMIEDSIHGLRVVQAVVRGLEHGVELNERDAIGLFLVTQGLIATLESAQQEVLKLQVRAAGKG